MIVAQTIQEILGDHLISLQLGNEPDLYANHLRRPSTYDIQAYMAEFQEYLNNIDAAPIPNKKIILGPRFVSCLHAPTISLTPPFSVCCQWSTEDVFNAGYLTTFANYLNVIGLMHYPNDNCAIGGAVNPQDELAAYLTHGSALNFYQFYASAIGQCGRGFVESETLT